MSVCLAVGARLCSSATVVEFGLSPLCDRNMPTITPERRDRILQQQTEMLADDARWCPFDDDTLARAWQRCDDLDLEDAIELRRELLERERLIELGRSTRGATVVTTDELLNERGYTRKQIKQLDDDGLLVIKWDKAQTRRKGYVLRAELDGLPERLRVHAEEQARQRRLKKDYIAGHKSQPNDHGRDGLPDCLR